MKPINSATRRYFKPAAFMLVLLALCFSLAMVVQLCPSPKAAHLAPARTALCQAGLDSRVSWYFESGQWLSDVHTLVNLLAYLVRPDPSPLTSLSIYVEARAISPVPIQS